MKKLLFAILLCLMPCSAFAAAHYYYVDPSATGGSNAGTAANPWTSASSINWTTINGSNGLADGDTYIYFSARVGASDTQESSTNYVSIGRTNCATQHATGCNRLTLDGMSQYNTDSTNGAGGTGSWTAYTGSNKHLIHASTPMRFNQTVFNNYVTVRGFELTDPSPSGSSSGCISVWGGDNIIVEYNEAHDCGGPAVNLFYSNWQDTTVPCVPDMRGNCGVYDFTVQYNTFYHTYGEGIYIGGCNNGDVDCSLFADVFHDRILIDNNTVYNTGCLGGQGDNIDPHGHTKNITISNNTTYFTSDYSTVCPSHGEQRDCIGIGMAATIYGNFLYNCGRCGIFGDDYWSEGVGFRNLGTLIYNNVFVNNGADYATNYVPVYSHRNAIFFDYSSGGDNWSNISMYNNTIYSAVGAGIEITAGVTSVNVVNNIVSQCGGVEFSAGSGTLSTHNYNNYYDTSGNIYTYGATSVAYNGNLAAEEANSIKTDPVFVSTSTPYAAVNFALQASSPAIEAGTSLAGTFTTDYAGLTRSVPWSMGAYEYVGTAQSATGCTISGGSFR